jgi:hypothetical protein
MFVVTLAVFALVGMPLGLAGFMSAFVAAAVLISKMSKHPSGTTVVGGGFIAAILGVLLVVSVEEMFHGFGQPAGATAVPPVAAQGAPQAKNKRDGTRTKVARTGVQVPAKSRATQHAKSLDQWACILSGGKTPDDVIRLIGRRPNSAEETGPSLAGVNRWLIYDYDNLILNRHTGKTDMLRVAFSWQKAQLVKEGCCGKELDVLLPITDC